jgi:hypothetical protein
LTETAVIWPPLTAVTVIPPDGLASLAPAAGEILSGLTAAAEALGAVLAPPEVLLPALPPALGLCWAAGLPPPEQAVSRAAAALTATTARRR